MFTGNMIFIDIISNITVGAGMIYNHVQENFIKINNFYNEFDLALNVIIGHYFPKWKIKKLLRDE